MLDVITIGDGMITMQPKTKGRMRYVNEFERKIGGAELNFALGCARLGLSTGWISRLGKDEFGRHILNFVRGEGVDVSQVKLIEGYPTSLNFKEIMEDGSGRTFYYRDNSATLTMNEEDLNEDYFRRASVLHISGVFPSIQEKNIDLIHQAIRLAKKHHMTVSFDPNIRLKMWSKSKAKDTLRSFLPYVDLVLTGKDEAALLLDTDQTEEIIRGFQDYEIDHIVLKKGAAGAEAVSATHHVSSPSLPTKAVDTVGAGDGFDAGFVYGWLKGWSLEESLKFANAIGSMVVSVMGDNEGLPYYEEVLEVLGETEKIER